MDYKKLLVKIGGMISVAILTASMTELGYNITPEEKALLFQSVQQIIMSIN